MKGEKKTKEKVTHKAIFVLKQGLGSPGNKLINLSRRNGHL